MARQKTLSDPKKYQEAIKWLEKLTSEKYGDKSKYGENAIYHKLVFGSLGACYYKVGDYDKAILTLEKSQVDPFNFYVLGLY